MRQYIGNISGNIESGSERNLLVAVAANGSLYFPARGVNIECPFDPSSTGRNMKYIVETYDDQEESANGPV